MPKYTDIKPWLDKDGTIKAVIETPRGCRNKYAFDDKSETFNLKKTLPEGMVFPYNFGFIPQTVAADGDPVDVLVLMDEPVFAGCICEIKLIGILYAEQIEKGKKKAVENNRLLGISLETHMYKDIKNIKDLGHNFTKELENFFVTYNEMGDKKYIPKGTGGVNKSLKYVKKMNKKYRKQ